MCGRYIDPNLRGTEFELSEIKIDPFPRRYNIKPTQEVYVLWEGELTCARWGLIPSWHKGTLKDWRAATINARIEEAASKPSFRGAWRYGRCLIPAGGYYEWTGDRSPKQPHFFSSAGNEETLWFAGLMSVWNDLRTCAIMTRAANDTVEPIHDRMPVILSTDERDAWLAGSGDPELGAGYRVKHYPVARFGISDDGDELIEPV
ncbi:SOS response-associated peptidase [Roseinatronobacter alkalisoli]|uniref:Abasic site processing protein n=1 Tax=Roseinatronobacter alkalisoli TaxID=3028235 RepID=A0ABT5T4L2_9RHOB|nr:SOS response-associated peptidase [Roseinatronobacter sp. HJB301]MDD7969934.1 SOS response-associated peptidase [Roseinatronobacter sp. HJB301]